MTVGPLFIRDAEDKYYPTTNDEDPSRGLLLPQVKTESKVLFYIDGEAYFRRIYNLLASLNSSAHFFYFTAWDSKLFKYNVADDELVIPIQGQNYHFGNLLVKKAKAGVKVRGLLWQHKIVSGRFNQNARQVYILRSKDNSLQGTILLNRRAHPWGAQHLKIIVAYDGDFLFGFVGGMDLLPNRLSSPDHSGAPNTNFWHDVAVEIRGPAAELVLDTFKKLWEHTANEQTQDDLKVKIGNDIKSWTDPPQNISKNIDQDLPSSFTHRVGLEDLDQVQLLRTLPQFNKLKYVSDDDWMASTMHKVIWPWCKPFNFAPKGDFSFKAGLMAAIRGAGDYVYMEDQYFWSTEVMDWLKAAIRREPNLNVILLTSGKIDPADKDIGSQVLTKAAYDYLYDGLSLPQKTRIKYFVRKDVTIHAKVCIIDDNWACIGSANVALRGLYTDIELSVGVLTKLAHGCGDPEVPELYEDKRFAKWLRIALWAHHHGITDANELKDLDRALTLWGFTPPLGIPPLRASAEIIPITFGPDATLPPGSVSINEHRYLVDPDSRMEY